jgi:hypothetical protein
MRKIIWKICLNSAPSEIFEKLTTDQGRERFWCEKSVEENGHVVFYFPNGVEYRGKVYQKIQNKIFKLDYFDSSVSFDIKSNEDGTTDLWLSNTEVDENEYSEILAGWVSVLMNLKAVCDYQVDLRNHDKNKTWDNGYADN